MIPTPFKPKYKALIRFRIDIWNNLTTKLLLKKKWRLLISLLRKRRKRKKQPVLLNYTAIAVSKFPVYGRYRYQKLLYFRQAIKLMYGGLQDSKLKAIAISCKIKSWRNFALKLEQKTAMFLYRLKLTSGIGEGKIHSRHKRVYVNGVYKEDYMVKGDVLHFSPVFENLLKRRLRNLYLLDLNPSKRLLSQDNKIYYRKRKKRMVYGINPSVDLDLCGMRFYFMENIITFKNHPFLLRFDKLLRWYTHV